MLATIVVVICAVLFVLFLSWQLNRDHEEQFRTRRRSAQRKEWK